MKAPGWTWFLSGFIVWTVHFFALYIIASIFPETLLARVLTVAVTVVCLGLAVLLFVRSRRESSPDPAEHWMRTVSQGGLAIAGIAIVWQGLPAILA